MTDCKCEKHGKHEICGNDCICRSDPIEEVEQPVIALKEDTNSESKKIELVKQIIDQAVDEKLKPIETQIAQLPTLVANIVAQTINQMQEDANRPQQQQAPQPSGDPNADKIAAVQGLLPIIQGLAPMFGLGQPTPQGSGNQAIMDMIVQSYMKKMQMDIDAQFMQTYQAPANIPSWANSPANPNLQRPNPIQPPAGSRLVE